MIHFDLPPQKSNIIKVLGFGGGGGNAVNHMFGQTIQNVDFIVCNTDAQALATSPVPNKIQLGPTLTSGLGAGANPNIGKQATEESLEEIRRMLEVNTKMAFITAGMGGGTGTGGAPIVAQICRELGILTVGIVTTPFSFEGPRRMAQAQAGVAELKEQVDTLLVISNDKLRHQFGNLKMKEAFSKADDVLCIAARCITDVINTTGQINVDFSDVCTVMKDGGVAILGSAQMAGEDRAIQAIEAATNSPLLNDNDISGAKWILLNITSADGDYGYTMDEVEVIQNYLRQQTGDDTDVILGMGYDDSLGDKIGITIIATGFKHKDPFSKPEPKKEAEAPPIVMTLGVEGDEKKMEQIAAPVHSLQPVIEAEPIMPLLSAKETEEEIFIPTFTSSKMDPVLEVEKEEDTEEEPLVFELNIDQTPPPVDKEIITEITQSQEAAQAQPELYAFLNKTPENKELSRAPMPPKPPMKKVVEEEPQLQLGFKMVENEEDPEALQFSVEEMEIEQPVKKPVVVGELENTPEEDLSQEELQKRRAQERMTRLRNLSYNTMNMDQNNEFEDTPAYLRRNQELHNTLANVEDFYSRANVKLDENNQPTIGTVNNFLHGDKPD